MAVQYQCDTVLTCGISFFFAVLNLKMQLKPSQQSSFFVDSVEVHFWLSSLLSQDRLGMSETSAIIGLWAKEGLLSFSFLFCFLASIQLLLYALLWMLFDFFFSCNHLLCQAPSYNFYAPMYHIYVTEYYHDFSLQVCNRFYKEN